VKNTQGASINEGYYKSQTLSHTQCAHVQVNQSVMPATQSFRHPSYHAIIAADLER